MDIQNNGFLSIEHLTERFLNTGKGSPVQNRTAEDLSFRQVLEQKSAVGQNAESLRFSKHAAVRLQDRGIELSNDQMERLNDGVKKAQRKGIRDSLVIVDQLAFIVNIPNQTVVTAMDSREADENVFTNINGAVIN